jgi:DivIVA domain-containing protein
VSFRLVIGIAWLAFCAIVAARNLSQRGPRPKIEVDDWMPNGWLWLPLLMALGLFCGGAWALFESGIQARIGGALSVAGATALVWLVVRYVRRPVREVEPPTPDEVLVTPEDARLPPFPRKFGGYDREQVEAFFNGIWSKSASEIAAARFSTRTRRGYDLQAVDRALDGWALRQNNLPQQPHG